MEQIDSIGLHEKSRPMTIQDGMWKPSSSATKFRNENELFEWLRVCCGCGPTTEVVEIGILLGCISNINYSHNTYRSAGLQSFELPGER